MAVHLTDYESNGDLPQETISIGQMPPRYVVPQMMHAWVLLPGKHGAAGTIVRTKFPGLFGGGKLGDDTWIKEAKEFGKAIWSVIGKGNNVDIVLEHPGQQTFPLSCFLVRRGGMIVFCAATTGYQFEFDARYIWMHQKRIQGSHFAHMKQADEANSLVLRNQIDPCVSEEFDWDELPLVHQLMGCNKHAPGNMVIRVACRASSPP